MAYPNPRAGLMTGLTQGLLAGGQLGLQINRARAADARYAQEQDYRRERDAIGDQRWNRDFGLRQEAHEFGLRRAQQADRDRRLGNLAFLHDSAPTEWSVEQFNQFGQLGGFDEIIRTGNGGAKLDGLTFSRFVPADEEGGYFAFMRTADGREVPYSVERGTDDDAVVFSTDDIRGYMQQALAGSDRYAEHVRSERQRYGAPEQHDELGWVQTGPDGRLHALGARRTTYGLPVRHPELGWVQQGSDGKFYQLDTGKAAGDLKEGEDGTLYRVQGTQAQPVMVPVSEQERRAQAVQQTGRDLVFQDTADAYAQQPAQRPLRTRSKANEPSANHKRYEELRAQGLPENVARGIAYGSYKTVNDPATGATTIIDVATGTEVGSYQRSDPDNFLAPKAWVNKTGDGATSLPPAARAALSEGRVTTFANGQRWTLQNGQPVQVQ